MTDTIDPVRCTTTAPGDRLDRTTKDRLLTAAARATTLYPGPVGELLSQELLSWMVFGHRLGSTLIMRLADDLLVRTPPRPTHDGPTEATRRQE